MVVVDRFSNSDRTSVVERRIEVSFTSKQALGRLTIIIAIDEEMGLLEGLTSCDLLIKKT